MLFLLFQIAFLLLLAALFGALLAYWWFKRRYEDVTESHALLIQQGEGQLDLAPLDARLGALQTQLDTPNRDLESVSSRLSILSNAISEDSGPDLKPMETRLARLEESVNAITIPDMELGPLHSGLAQLELSLQSLDIPATDLDPVHAQVRAVEERLEDIIIRLEKAHAEEAEAITTRLNHVSASVDALQMPDMVLVRDRLANMEAAIYNLDVSGTDTSGLEERINELQTYLTTPDYNMIELRDRLAGIEGSIYQMDFRADPVDFGPVQQRLEVLQTQLTTADPGIIEIRDRLADIEASLGNAAPMDVDLTPLQQRLEFIQSHITAPNQDIDSLHARLANLEYSISALDIPAVDINPVHARLASMEAELGAIRTELHGTGQLEVIEQRLNSLHESILSVQQPDFSPVISSMHAIDNRLDLTGLENRLTAIEYGLAAVHHTMRSRPDVFATPAVAEHQAPPPRRAAPPPPIARPAPPPPPPVRQIDPVIAARRPGDLANLLVRPAFGRADDLERISGVGPMLGDLLNDVGVYYFWQIAEWSAQDVDYVDDQLQHFRGRIERDDWVGQAKLFAAEPATANRPDVHGRSERY